MSGGNGAVGGPGVIYVRRRKGSADKVEETDASRKPRRDAGGGYGRGREVREKDVSRKGKDAANAFGEGADREFDTGDEEGEGFWGLTLKDGLSKRKMAEASGGSMSKPKVSVKVDKLMKDGEKHKVQSRDGRREANSGKKRALRDMEKKKPVVVIGLRCIADDSRLKTSRSTAKLHTKKHQLEDVDMGGGRNEWGWSRQISLRVQVESAEASTQKSGEEDVSGEEVMTLAKMRFRLNQKAARGEENPRRRKENKKEKAGEKQVGVGDENDHERVMERIMNDKEEEQENNDRDVDDENEYEEGEEERENKGESWKKVQDRRTWRWRR